MMRIHVALAGVALLIVPLGMSCQKKPDHNVRIICPPVHTRVVKLVRPVYPKEARESGIEGKVSLRCIIGTDGSVEKVEVIKGEEPLMQAAKTAVAQWKYKPLVLHGVAVEMDTTVDVLFQLEKKSK